MSDPLAQSLARLVRERPEGLERPRLLEALLRDLHPERPARVAALVEVLNAGLLERLRVADAQSHEARVEALVAALVRGSGLSPRSAWWAVDAWLAALAPSDAAAISAAVEPHPAPGPAARGEAPPKDRRTLGEALAAALAAAPEEPR